jgi:hypothetical protein
MHIRTALLLAITARLGAAAPVAADVPEWEEVSVDETFYRPLTSAACGFDVFEHDEGLS